jgi:hypothetical protein
MKYIKYYTNTISGKYLREELIKIQNNKCSICEEEFYKQKEIHIDHDHISDEIRGLICHDCNMILGFSKDNITILNRAIEYLKNPPLKNKIIEIEKIVRIKKEQHNKNAIENKVISMKKIWSKPEHRNNMVKVMIDRYSDPKERELHSTYMKKGWETRRKNKLDKDKTLVDIQNK